MSESNSAKQQKLKASLEDFVGPLLKQLGNCPEAIIVEKIRKLVERNKDVIESTQDWESKQMSLLGRIERQIDYWKEKKVDDGDLLRNFEELVETEGLDLPMVSILSDANKAHISENNTISEVGEPSYSNDNVHYRSVNLEELGNVLDRPHKNCLYSLGLFPENAKLKKRLLLNWWKGLWLKSSHAEEFFHYLIEKGILKPNYTREHNGDIDLCTIDQIFRTQLVSAGYKLNFKREGTLQLCMGMDQHWNWAIASLNVDQKYLNSRDIKNIFANCQSLTIVQLGRWDCSTDAKLEVKRKKSGNHIEVDDSDFLKSLPRGVIYLSLRGISRINELPKSIGELQYLKILDLRACHNLEKLPQKRWSNPLRSKSQQVMWFNNLIYLDISECYLLDQMPKWICEIHSLKVLKGFVAGSGGKKNKFCRLGDLSKLRWLKKLSIRISKHWDPEEASGFEDLDCLSVLTVTWPITENENESNKIQEIAFPTNLTKLDIRCFPEVDAMELLNPEKLPKLERLYIRGGKLTKMNGCNSSWEVKILRLRFLQYLELDWDELHVIFPKLDCVEYEQCPSLRYFPEEDGSAWKASILTTLANPSKHLHSYKPQMTASEYAEIDLMDVPRETDLTPDIEELEDEEEIDEEQVTEEEVEEPEDDGVEEDW